MRSFLPRYEVVFSGGVFYGAERILRSGIAVFQTGGDRQRTLLLRECAFYVVPHLVKQRFLRVLFRQTRAGGKCSLDETTEFGESLYRKSSVFAGAERKLCFPVGKYLTRRIRGRRTAKTPSPLRLANISLRRPPRSTKSATSLS